MKISKTMEKVLNEQINKEIFSGYLYLSMSAWFESQNLGGFASWMRKQTKEENKHAMKFFRYVIERAGDVKLAAIEAPKLEWKSPLDAFEEAYKHECFITESINKLVDLAKEEDDKASASFLQWYIDEQVEEEDQTLKIVEQLKIIGDSKNALFMLNSVLGKRE